VPKEGVPATNVVRYGNSRPVGKAITGFPTASDGLAGKDLSHCFAFQEGRIMDRRQVLFGALGLVLAAATARADAPKTVKILGQQYTVTANPRYGAFKNGVTVNLQKGGGCVADADVAKKANLCFVPGADPSKDRLFVVAAHQDDPGPTSDGLYLLTGADANGVFSPATSDATVLLRGNRDVHGRWQNITFLTDDNSTPGKNRNLYGMSFTGQNRMRWLDLGALLSKAPHMEDNAFRTLSSFSIKEPDDTCAPTPPDVDPAMDDANAPSGTYDPGALAPNGMLIVAGNDPNGTGDVALSVIDPIKGTNFFPVKTDLVTATNSKYVSSELPHTFVHLSGDDYLLIATDPDSGVNATEGDLNSQHLYQLHITLPADLANGKADSIKVDLVGMEDLPALKLGQSPSAKIYGLAVGRNAASGKPILYMADWAGNLFTLTPQ
jgi:hypothetical protein